MPERPELNLVVGDGIRLGRAVNLLTISIWFCVEAIVAFAIQAVNCACFGINYGTSTVTFDCWTAENGPILALIVLHDFANNGVDGCAADDLTTSQWYSEAHKIYISGNNVPV